MGIPNFIFQNKTILIISPQKWGMLHISKHHYAIELAKLGNKVFFVNPPDIKSSSFKISPSGISDNLQILTYRPLFRGQKYLPAFIFNRLVELQVYFLKRFINTDIDAVFSFANTYFINLKWFNAKYSFFCPYDQLNDEAAYKIADSADYVITVAQYIADEIKKTKTPILLLNHGLSSDFVKLAENRIEQNNFTDYSSKSEKIKIGFVGNLLMEFLDRVQLKKIIEQNPEIQFVFWGPKKPIESNISAWVDPLSLNFISFLESRSNVVLKGPCSPQIVSQQIQEMDGFLFCHIVHPENKMHNSHKILEYLSTGKMVVATSLDAYKKTNDGLVLVHNQNENNGFPLYFKEQIAAINKNNSLELQRKRISYAIANSYSNQVRNIEKWVNSNVAELITNQKELARTSPFLIQIPRKIIQKVRRTVRYYFSPGHLSLLLRHFFNKQEPIFEDSIHLTSAMQWLVKAYKESGANGVSLSYSMNLGWLPPYPETTGYIIHSFIQFYKYNNNKYYLDKAIEFGNWEIAIQLPDGGVRIQRPDNSFADVFDTGMVLLGFIELYIETQNSTFLESAKKAGDWLISKQDEDGKWSKFSYKDIPHVYHSKVSWALYWLYSVTKNENYRIAAEKNITWIFSVQHNNGWFDYMGFTQNENPYTHTIAYTLQGFWGIYKFMDSQNPLKSKLFSEIIQFSDNIIGKFKLDIGSKSMLMLPGELNNQWQGASDYVCLTGNAQFAIVWYELYLETLNKKYYSAATNLLNVVKKAQIINKSSLACYHGISGSYPIWGNYHPNEYPNWPAKFFADALLLKIKIDRLSKQ